MILCKIYLKNDGSVNIVEYIPRSYHNKCDLKDWIRYYRSFTNFYHSNPNVYMMFEDFIYNLHNDGLDLEFIQEFYDDIPWIRFISDSRLIKHKNITEDSLQFIQDIYMYKPGYTEYEFLEHFVLCLDPKNYVINNRFFIYDSPIPLNLLENGYKKIYSDLYIDRNKYKKSQK